MHFLFFVRNGRVCYSSFNVVTDCYCESEKYTAMGLFRRLKFWGRKKLKKSEKEVVTELDVEQKEVMTEEEVEEELKTENIALKEKLNNLRAEIQRKEEEIKDMCELVKQLEKAINEEREKISEIYELATAPVFSVWQKVFFAVSGTIVAVYHLLTAKIVW